MDTGIPALPLFLQKDLPSLLASSCFVVRYFSFVKQAALVVLTDYSVITTKSPILFFTCPQMVAFEYFQHDLIFHISE